MKNVLAAADSLGMKEITKEWLHLFTIGWIISPTSCSCGGSWAWMKPRSSGAMEMHGCVCHQSPIVEIAPGLVYRPKNN